MNFYFVYINPTGSKTLKCSANKYNSNKRLQRYLHIAEIEHKVTYTILTKMLYINKKDLFI